MRSLADDGNSGNINATVNVVPHSHLGDEPNFHDFDAEHEHKRLHSLHGEHKRKKKHSGRRLHPEEERPSKWPLNLFKSKKENDEPEHAPLPPAFIGAFSTSGHIFSRSSVLTSLLRLMFSPIPVTSIFTMTVHSMVCTRSAA